MCAHLNVSTARRFGFTSTHENNIVIKKLVHTQKERREKGKKGEAFGCTQLELHAKGWHRHPHNSAHHSFYAESVHIHYKIKTSKVTSSWEKQREHTAMREGKNRRTQHVSTTFISGNFYWNNRVRRNAIKKQQGPSTKNRNERKCQNEINIYFMYLDIWMCVCGCEKSFCGLHAATVVEKLFSEQ